MSRMPRQRITPASIPLVGHNRRKDNSKKRQTKTDTKLELELTFEILSALTLFARFADNLDWLTGKSPQVVFLHSVAILSSNTDLDQCLDAFLSLVHVADIQLFSYTSSDACRVRLGTTVR